ncbi:M23 family metallopeptidase [Rathayibacter sp. YIM 133350]|uniref:M23 family metallopeptidase n=1 Tax=Rathayibacter sp. YIM 133350 TaxID=3131992 RepID=UPI00307EB716
MSGDGEPALTRRQLRERERAANEASSTTDAPPAAGVAVPLEDAPTASVEDETLVVVEPAAPAVHATEEHPVVVVEEQQPTSRARNREALRRTTADLTSDDLPPAPPRSRREARTNPVDEVTAQARRSAHSDAVTTRAKLTTQSVPVVTAAPKKPSRHSAKKGLATTLVMGVVALIAIATSVPANALLSPADVQAAAAVTNVTAKGEAQSVHVSDAVGETSVQRDGYGAESLAQVAASSGIRPESATFTNDPNGTVQWPFMVGVHIGDRFGYRNCAGCSEDHHGQDFNPGLGADIQAIADGVVSFAEDGDGDLGVHMMITHQINGQTVTSVYAHMQHGSMRFKVGDQVKVGDIIGTVGTTGMSTGPHLHFEIRLGGINGPWTDPLVWLYANTN